MQKRDENEELKTTKIFKVEKQIQSTFKKPELVSCFKVDITKQ